jgi:hypothetical protein
MSTVASSLILPSARAGRDADGVDVSAAAEAAQAREGGEDAAALHLVPVGTAGEDNKLVTPPSVTHVADSLDKLKVDNTPPSSQQLQGDDGDVDVVKHELQESQQQPRRTSPLVIDTGELSLCSSTAEK